MLPFLQDKLANGDMAMFWDRITRRPSGLSGGGSTDSDADAGAARQAGGASGSPAAGPAKPRIGLALGAGAARGWAHIGVLRTLIAAGIKPDIISGTSIGAVVGGCFAAGKLDELEEWARSLTKRRMVGLMDFHIGGSGLISGEKLRQLLGRELADATIESLPLRFATIATELGSGHEIWLTRGSLIEAVRASYALPGIFDPVRLGGRWLIDGALVNPIPVTAARAMGADIVLCVNLNSEVGGRGTIIQTQATDPEHSPLIPEVEVTPSRGWLDQITGAAGRVRSFVGNARPSEPAPGIAGVMIDAFNITQDRISRSRLAGDPPDAMISPRLSRIGLFDFHRADEAISAGRIACERALDDIRETVGLVAPG
jgi:NTE family protein